MPRVKRSNNAQKKRRKVLDESKGYFGLKKNTYRKAKEQLLKSYEYAYRDRKNRKREFRRLWITRINAGARLQRPELQPVHARAQGGRTSTSTARSWPSWPLGSRRRSPAIATRVKEVLGAAS